MENTPCTQDGTDALLASLAERQHSVFHIRQALALGMTPRMVQSRAKKERIVRLHRGVYRLAGVAPTWRQHVMAACLALGPGTVASHRSAGALWSLDGMEKRLVEVTVTGRAARLKGVMVHRTRALPAWAVTTRDRIPVTKAHRTVMDLASVVDELRLEQALDSALRQGLMTVPYLRRQLRAIGTAGRSGAASLTRLLAARDGGRPSDSPPELAMARLFVAAGLPDPTLQYELWDGDQLIARFACTYPEPQVAAEYNSYRHHSRRQAWSHDQARNNRAAAYGWLVFTFTDADLHDPEGVAVKALARAYGARARRTGRPRRPTPETSPRS
ncbi:MAG: type IV toxin-antitoxin system AbiEi family antitoxin domain-containing protein [Actinomycetota bacterium]|nr:type IV toxin-antitoxin system AbiEi family antitoxin domain-containing protein [Actinomycetota bacterium]